ncbi:MAG: sodium-dependent transporter [Planctomycetota bacterium]
MPEQRERWNSRTAFVMAAIGSAVGLGNVWRFPVVCYANGGGAFLIPYLVALLTAGIPLMILEMGIGQMMQGSAPKSLKKVNRHTEWVGWFALMVALAISCYYAAIMAYSVEYLVYSFKGFANNGQMAWMGYEGGPGKFFTEQVLQSNLDAGTMWQPVGYVWAGLVLTWVAVFFCVAWGVKAVSKIVMWTVPLPIVLLLVLIVRGITLEGAGDGIMYYLTPQFEALKNPQTWLAAYGQIFFSLTLGFGVMIAYASYQSENSDVTNNAFITCFSNCAISFIAGFAVFSVLGFLAASQGAQVQDVVTGGPGLAFVTYPTAVAKMAEVGWFWAPVVGVLFFLMLLFLGIDSLFSLVEAAVSGLKDKYAFMTQMNVTAGLCVVGLGTGVLFASRAGIMWVDIFDYWTNNYGLVIVGLLQCIVVGYFYKTDNLRAYINRVSEIKLWGWWELCIRLVTPFVLVYLIGKNLLDDLTGAGLYGIADARGTAFEGLLWVPPVVLAVIATIGMAMSRLWIYLVLIVGGLCVTGLTWFVLRTREGALPAAMFCGFAAAILIGGLLVCIDVARRGKAHGDQDVDPDDIETV